ncbi:MAG TPA: response regulator [Candidatus Saccharimonas sp.]|nr:response regulator [Candidatus Saccharimonas sp.]
MASVLLVEDDGTIREMNAFALQRAGYEVGQAMSGAEAMVRVQERSYDVILLDMMMAGMSGLDFLRQYDVRVNCPQTKVVALSAIDSPKVVEEAKQLGVIDYLSKADTEPRQLVEYVGKLVAAPAASGAAVEAPMTLEAVAPNEQAAMPEKPAPPGAPAA